MSVSDEIKDMKFPDKEQSDKNELITMIRMLEDEIQYKERMLNALKISLKIISENQK